MPTEPCPSHSFPCRSHPRFLEYPALLPLGGPTVSPWAERRPQPLQSPPSASTQRGCVLPRAPGALPSHNAAACACENTEVK